MKINLMKKIVVCTLAAVFAATPIAKADGLANASINSTMGGFVGMETGTNSATLNFDNHAHVDWNTLNVNSNETLNFNAVNGATGLTVLNTVSGGQMSHIYGTVNANEGIDKLIISNPSGLMFDGANFTTAGDLMLTTQGLTSLWTIFANPDEPVGDDNVVFGGVAPTSQAALNSVTIKDSDFNVGGTFNLVGPKLSLIHSNINAPRLKLTTKNGQDFLVNNYEGDEPRGVQMRAVNVNGNILIESGKDPVNISDGCDIDSLSIYSEGDVNINYSSANPRMNINGGLHVDVTGDDGQKNDIRIRNVNAKEYLMLNNSKGDVILRDVSLEEATPYEGGAYISAGRGYNSSSENVILMGNNSFDGTLDLNASGNVIIGNLGVIQDRPASSGLNVADGLFIKTFNGSVLFKDNVNANVISVDSAKNILTAAGSDSVNGETAMLNANTYGFFANGYVGAVEDPNSLAGIMNYQLPISNSIRGYMNIGGGLLMGNGNTSEVRIKSHDDLTVSSYNAMNMYLTSVSDSNQLGSDITINSGVNANRIVVGGETKALYVPQEQRSYDLQFTNIRDNEITRIARDQAITYEDFNAPGGYNDGVQTEFNTWVEAPEEPSRFQVRSINLGLSELKTIPLMISKKKK